jgi:class 3 adenylate cyclase
MDHVNTELNSLLAARIGVNTGYSSIAGVLRTDKSTPSIVGNPIKIAANVQNPDIPGKI